jgi:uncharacterized membrane protein
MINILIVSIGIFLLVFGISQGIQIRRIVDKNIIKYKYILIVFFISLFILGYFVFILKLLFFTEFYDLYDHVVSLVFFLGSVFVVLVIRVNRNLFLKINKQVKELGKINDELKRKNNIILEKAKICDSSEDQCLQASERLKEKIKELENLNDMFIEREERVKDLKKQIEDLKK